jgi:transcriptional regulator with XRE-family HTH domain
MYSKTLSEIRQAKGRSAADLAEHLYINIGYIKRLEAGFYLSHSIDQAIVPKLYRFYGPAIYRNIKD